MGQGAGKHLARMHPAAIFGPLVGDFMQSVPVRETILRAYGFAVRRALPLLGLGWLSAVFYFAATAYFLTRLSATMLVWPRPDAGSFNNFAFFYLFCLVLVTALANAVMSVALTREALAPGEEWKSAYFSIARREWSLFLNLMLLYVIVIGMVVGVLFAGQVAIAVATPMIGNGGVWKGVDLPPLMNALSIVIAISVGLFLAVRFGFFTAPMAAGDPPVRLLHAWVLSRGNFWRLLTVSFGIVLPILLVCAAMEWAVLGSQLNDTIGALIGDSRDNTAFFQMIGDHAEAIAAIWAGSLFVLNAVFAGASADAYRQVEHNVDLAETHEYAPLAEPVFAMAAPAAAVAAPAVVESPRLDPPFVKEEPKEEPKVEATSEVVSEPVAETPVATLVEAPATLAMVDVVKKEELKEEPAAEITKADDGMKAAEAKAEDTAKAEITEAKAEAVDARAEGEKAVESIDTFEKTKTAEPETLAAADVKAATEMPVEDGA